MYVCMYVCMQVIVHHNPKRPLHNNEKREQKRFALIGPPIGPFTSIARIFQQTVLPNPLSSPNPKKDMNLSRGRRLKEIKEWKFSVEGGGEEHVIPVRMDLPRGGGERKKSSSKKRE